MNLFEHSQKETLKKEAPLADRMRPRYLEELIGQSHILAPGRLLWRSIKADQLTSIIFYGPPGTGKTSLARIIANTTQAEFLSINAVLSGISDIRSCIETAKKVRIHHQRRAVLFIDEVHRFNKSQQDALLPHVEKGTIILVGATTENPYFEVNKALVSRSRIFQLKSLESIDIEKIINFAIADKERGYGDKKILIDTRAIKHLADVAGGDARAALNALELAVLSSISENNTEIKINLKIAEESIQRRAILYDKDGDTHFDIISAFIKSMRGSDPDAALYWMAKMVEAGENPRFIFRRMLIFAGEDIGMADPHALLIVNAASQAFDYVGMPEGRFHLAQACLYLSTAPKSNSTFAFFDAIASVRNEESREVPNPLKDPNRDAKGLGHGEGYLYPHAYSEHWVAQQYLPHNLQGKLFYQPTEQGFEASIKNRVAKYREAQFAASFSQNTNEINKDSTYWENRTLNTSGDLLGKLRNHLTKLSNPSKDSLTLILKAGDGLILGEFLRHILDETIYAIVETLEEKKTINKLYEKPVSGIIPNVIVDKYLNPESFKIDNLCFDYIVGHNVLIKQSKKTKFLEKLNKWISKNSYLVFGESVPCLCQRLSDFIPENALDFEFIKSIKNAEEKIYNKSDNFQSNWNPSTLRNELEICNWTIHNWDIREFTTPTMIRKKQIKDWFSFQKKVPPKSYGQELSNYFSSEQLEILLTTLEDSIGDKVVSWKNTSLFMKLSKKYQT
tara:strand:- start:2661 stop:4862 length:2202 start_codon:yes stop_codon:yes gene_type:complete